MTSDTSTHSQRQEGHQPTAHLILIVEDDEGIGSVLCEIIESETAYQTHLVTNGFEALKFIMGIQPSLFLLDYHLPGMNGLELYDALHTIPEIADIPAIFMSATLPSQELQKRMLTAIEKPLHINRLITALQAALG